DDGRSLAHVGYEAGDLIVPSRRPGAGASRLVRARSPDPPVLCDGRLRPSARHLETYGQSNGGGWRPPPNPRPTGGVWRPSPNETPKGGIWRPSPNEANSQRKQSGSEGGQDQLCSMPPLPCS